MCLPPKAKNFLISQTVVISKVCQEASARCRSFVFPDERCASFGGVMKYLGCVIDVLQVAGKQVAGHSSGVTGFRGSRSSGTHRVLGKL